MTLIKYLYSSLCINPTFIQSDEYKYLSKYYFALENFDFTRSNMNIYTWGMYYKYKLTFKINYTQKYTIL